MSKGQYFVFKEKESDDANHLVFSQKGYVKGKTPFEQLRLLILHFPDRSYHYLVQDPFFYEYHEGNEFTTFLKTNGVPTAEYTLSTAKPNASDEYEQSNGALLQISKKWIETGYSYVITDKKEAQPSLHFTTGKGGHLKFDATKRLISVDFVTKDQFESPAIQQALKEVKKSKQDDKVRGCLTVVFIIIAFYLLGQLWLWLFGAPDDPFINTTLLLF